MKRTFAVLFVGAAVLLGLMIGLGLLDVHVLAHSSIGRADRSADSTLAGHRDHLLNSLTLLATDVASTLQVIAVAAVVVVVTALVFKRWREPLFVVAVIVGEVTIFVATTLVVHRPRPDVVRLDRAPPTSSFPSGHTAASVALYGTVATLIIFFGARAAWRWLGLAVAVLIPLIVACSRVYRGMHYPTDVLGGAVLGFTWLRLSAYAILNGAVRPAQSRESAREQVPSATAPAGVAAS